jgi:hypothetical protein
MTRRLEVARSRRLHLDALFATIGGDASLGGQKSCAVKWIKGM